LANQIILWDLVHHTQKVISNHANSYSAYFIKHSRYFMWQELPANQLQFATSAGKPPIDKLQLVGQNKLGIISEEDKKFYVYFCGNLDKINTLGAVVKKPLPLDDNAQFLVHGDLRHYGDNFDFSPYGRPYNLVTELVSQMRFIEVLITLGYQSGNIVHVQDVSGKEVLHFDNFPVYGQVMRANLKDYFASSFNWNVYQGYGATQKLIMIDDGGFYSGKLLNLTLSDAKPLLLTSGDAPDGDGLVTGTHSVLGNMSHNAYGVYLISKIRGVTLWNSQTGQPLHGFKDNIGLTFGTLSPDGNYVLAGDENMYGYIWSTKTYQKIQELPNIFDDSNSVKVPDYFRDDHGGQSNAVLALKFIDDTHYLRFSIYTPVAILYSIYNKHPLKYFQLGNTFPAVYDFSQDQALDASPSAHILVMAMSGQRGGILEYQYDPKAMTLKRIWIGHLAMPPIADGEIKSKDKANKGWFF
jgi:WD40 repeat protein